MLTRDSLEEQLLPPDDKDNVRKPSGPQIERQRAVHTESAITAEPSSEKYTVDYEGETLSIDSNDWRHSTLLKAQILTSYLYFIIFGMAEQTVGALIPMFQKHYLVGDMQTSLIFLTTVIGYVTAAVMNEGTHKRLGVKGVLMTGGMFMIIGYAAISLQPPFALLVCFYVFNGLALGSLDAGINTWMGGLRDSNQILGILHGCYGIGCMISPPLISHLLTLEKNPWKWYQYYRVLALLAVLGIVLVAVTFRYETAKKHKYLIVMKSMSKTNEVEMLLLETTDPERTIESSVSPHASTQSFESTPSVSHTASFSEVVRSKLVWTFALVLFTYVGGEVAFGSWLISFLMRIKKLKYKTSSYMATSFWTGLTVGRICLGFVTELFFADELTANLVYIAASTGGMLLFYLLAFTNAISLLFVVVFLTGIAIGPIFPTVIVASINILPAKFHTGGVGFICAFGGGGGAAVPLLIGLIAESSSSGMRNFPLVICVLYALLVVAWYFIRRSHR